jgi:hypothetical protein
MAKPSLKVIVAAVIVLLAAAGGWTCFNHSLVPAVHEDHDHALENIAGGGFLRVERVEGGTRNLVGGPNRVLILHGFELGSPSAVGELPAPVDHASTVVAGREIEVVMAAVGRKRSEVLDWANAHGVPIERLYVDPQSETAQLVGARQIPEPLIHDPEGRPAHQARGPMNWSDPGVRARIEAIKHGAGEQQH